MIYYVEDDINIHELALYALRQSGLEAQGFPDAGAFRQACADCPPDLVLLDIMLPGEDGLSILSWIRNASAMPDVPVMMLTAKGTEFDKVQGLDAGADDYLAKPFGMMELIARVRALLRRTKKDEPSESYCLGSLKVLPDQHIVEVDGERISLTYKEFEMLLLLLRNRDLVLTREQFLDKIWGYSFDGESRTVDVHIRTLRQKLGAAGKYIRTIRGVGYKLEEAPDET